MPGKVDNKRNVVATASRERNDEKKEGKWPLIAAVVASIFAALASGYGAYQSSTAASLAAQVQKEIADGQRNSTLLKYAIDVLTNKETAGDTRLRSWAWELLKKTSPVNIPEELSRSLINGTYTLPRSNVGDVIQFREQLKSPLGEIEGFCTGVNCNLAANPDVDNTERPAGDTWITAKVKAELLMSNAAVGPNINVSTTNGVVTLAGVVRNQAEVDKAIAVAKSTKGVTEVDIRALKILK